MQSAWLWPTIGQRCDSTGAAWARVALFVVETQSTVQYTSCASGKAPLVGGKLVWASVT